MGKSILVTGGTGTLGSVLVRRLRDEGHEVAVLSRRAGWAGRPVTCAPAKDSRPPCQVPR